MIVSFHAQNLVPNGDFETFTSCPFNIAQVSVLSPWMPVSNHTGTADYFNSCSVFTNPSTPTNIFGHQQPLSGAGYCGLFSDISPFFGAYREYITVPLISPLVSGGIYSVGFHVSLAEVGSTAGDGFGAYISTGAVTGAGNSNELPYTPQIENPSGNILSDSINWTLISGIYFASGGEDYLTIGNFKNHQNTLTQTFPPGLASGGYLYYLDDVYLIQIPTVTHDICIGDSVTLQGFADTQYAWADSIAPNVILSTDSSFTVSPLVSTTYFLYGTSDTVSFNVNVNSTFPIIDLGNDTTLCEGEILLLDASEANSTTIWQDGSTTPMFNVVQQGVYWVEIIVDQCSTSDTILVNYTPLPIVNLGNDTILCLGDSIILDVSDSNATYLWQDNSADSIFTVTQQGTYFVTVTVNNCSTTDTIVISYYPPYTVNLGNDTTLCQGDSILLNASTLNATYLWQDGSTNTTFNVTQQDTFWVTVLYNNCPENDTIVVNYVSPPFVNLGNDTLLCTGATFTLDASTPNMTYLWQDNSTDSTFDVIQQGTHWVELTSVEGCVNSDTIDVIYIPAISVDLGPDIALCQGETVSFDATTPNSTYLWQDGGTFAQVLVTQTGQYYVDVTNQCETVSDTVNVDIFNPPTLYLGNDTIACLGNSIVLNVGIPGTQTQWQDQSISNTFTVTVPGTYSALTTNINGCSTSDEITIDFITIPELDLGPDYLICEDEEQLIVNFSNGQGSYLWSTGSFDNQILIDTAGIFSVQLSNQCGTAADTILIENKLCDCFVYVPNSFTPNYDEYNRNFGAFYDCIFTDFTMTIFNRWGELIWESNDPEIRWDGTYGNKKALDGTYVYRIKYSSEFVFDEVVTGHFLILR